MELVERPDKKVLADKEKNKHSVVKKAAQESGAPKLAKKAAKKIPAGEGDVLVNALHGSDIASLTRGGEENVVDEGDKENVVDEEVVHHDTAIDNANERSSIRTQPSSPAPFGKVFQRGHTGSRSPLEVMTSAWSTYEDTDEHVFYGMRLCRMTTLIFVMYTSHVKTLSFVIMKAKENWLNSADLAESKKDAHQLRKEKEDLVVLYGHGEISGWLSERIRWNRLSLKADLAESKKDAHQLRKEKEDLVVLYGHGEIVRHYLIKEYLMTFLHRILQSNEYKRSTVEHFNLAIASGRMKGISVGRPGEAVKAIIDETDDLNPEASSKFME
nr:hypothetical protein [Tanacetum cinerariifolium]